jgi:hypothetical protein
MKSRILNVFALVFNAAIVALGLFAILTSLFGPAQEGFSNGYDIFRYYTYDSNILMVLVAFIALIFNIVVISTGKNKVPGWLSALKLISTCAIGVTILVVLFILAPNAGNEWAFGGNNFYLHLIIPCLALVSYIFFEVETKVKWRYTFLVLVPMVIYGAIYITMVETNTWEDFYHFLDGNKIYYIPALLVVGTYALGIILWLLNKLLRLIYFGYEYHDADIPEVNSEEQIQPQNKELISGQGQIEEIKPQEEVQSEESAPIQKSNKSSKKPATNNIKYKDQSRVYHISRSKLVGKWQVKLASGERAIKLFDTQLEAIKYAKELVKSNGGSIRIHSMRGQLRKNN